MNIKNAKTKESFCKILLDPCLSKELTDSQDKTIVTLYILIPQLALFEKKK